jgi:hypothetical protein
LGVASGQTAGISGPVEGFTFDFPTASLRAVRGYPGAASFGPPILAGLEFASVAPQRNYAVAFQNGNFLVLSNLDSGKASSLAVPSVTRVPEAVSWSNDGTFAVLWSAGANWLETLSGLPSSPAAGAYIDVSALGGSLTAVAIDSTGKRIAIAVSGSQSGVYLVTGSQGFAPIGPQLANPVAVSFSSDGTQLFAIDAGAKQLAIVNLSNSSSQMTALDGLADPFAVQGSAARIYIASRSDRLLRELDASANQLVDIPLSFSPRGIEPFGANSLLLASRSMASDPLWLVTNGTQPAAYFVPAIPQTIGKPRPSNPDPVAPTHGRGERER